LQVSHEWSIDPLWFFFRDSLGPRPLRDAILAAELAQQQQQ
jgi:hypothetical protein